MKKRNIWLDEKNQNHLVFDILPKEKQNKTKTNSSPSFFLSLDTSLPTFDFYRDSSFYFLLFLLYWGKEMLQRQMDAARWPPISFLIQWELTRNGQGSFSAFYLPIYTHIYMSNSFPPSFLRWYARARPELRSFGIICEDCIDCVTPTPLFGRNCFCGTNVTLRRKKRLDTGRVPTTGRGEGWLWLRQYLSLALKSLV